MWIIIHVEYGIFLVKTYLLKIIFLFLIFLFFGCNV